MRVHVVQLSYGDNETLDARVERVAAIVRAQQGADLVVLPELWPNGGFAYDGWEASAQPLDGPVVTALREAARELGALVHMGSFVERDETGRMFNTSLLLGDDGSVLATYRKIHLFGFGEGEPKLMTPGDDVVVHEGLGLATCYDLRFPEQFRRLLDAGAEIVLLPAAWPAKRVAHWRLLAQARAIENQSYVVACNTAGKHSGVRMGGGSLVVDPWGAVLAEAGTDEEVLVADLDLESLARTRSSFPILADRRL
jgi:predicted amidohydrolase